MTERLEHGISRSERAFQRFDDLVTGTGLVETQVSDAIRTLQAASPGLRPLTREFASRFLELGNPRIALLTGFVVPELFPHGENDGPLGSIVLAHALARVGLEPILYTDPPIVETARWLAAELGATFPVHSISSLRLDRHSPSFGAVIAIEKPGANDCGTMHTFDGQAIRHGSLEVETVFHACQQQAIPTMAIGDRGNEVGFGAIREAVLQAFPHAAHCQCGCGAGMVAASHADLVLPAAVSNWGAYGVCAALALLTNRLELSHTPEAEERLLYVAAVRGCSDGVLRRSGFAVDGLPGHTSVRFVEVLRGVIQEQLENRAGR